MSLLHPYEDRKKLKWYGFQLSEHTATLAQQKKEQLPVRAKPQMTTNEISEILQQAQLKNTPIAIQTNQIIDDSYLSPIEGVLTGYTEEGIFLNQTLIGYDEIRHVEPVSLKKWSQIND